MPTRRKRQPAAELPEQLELRVQEAARAFAEALRRELGSQPLPTENNQGIIREVTSAQLERRGAAVARAKAKKSGSPVALAIVASSWKNQETYAKRCGCTQGTLSKYIRGVLPAPRSVADRVLADFGLGHDVWPAGLAD